jgi:hypothetical protein
VVTYNSTNDCTLALITDSGTDLTLVTGKTQTNKYIGLAASPTTGVVKSINTFGNGWVAVNPGETIGNYDDAFAYTLAAGIYTVSGNTNIPLDRTGRYFTEEITNSKDSIAAVIGGTWKPTSFFYPRWAYDADAKTKIKSEGFTVALAGTSAAISLSSIPDIFNLTNSVYGTVANITGSGYSELNDSEKEERMRGFARSLALTSKYYGLWTVIYLRNPDIYSDFLTSEDVGWIVDELNKTGILIKSLNEAQTYISGNSSANGDGFVRTISSNSDFRLQSGSPCINAGTDVGLTTDYAGAAIVGNPDIGAYEFINDFVLTNRFKFRIRRGLGIDTL